MGNINYLTDERLDFDEVGGFYEGYARVKKDGKYNFINKTGNLLFPSWIDCKEIYYTSTNNDWNPGTDNVGDFHEGYAKITYGDSRGGSTNFIDKTGSLLFKEWLGLNGVVGDFHEGYARIDGEDAYGMKYNFIDKNGEFLFKEGYQDNDIDNYDGSMGDFNDGFALFKQNKAYITSSHPLSSLTTDGEMYYDDDGHAIDEDAYMKDVDYREDYANKTDLFLIDQHGKKHIDIMPHINLSHKEYYEETGDISDGFILLRKDGKYNFIDIEGRFLFEDWMEYNEVSDFYEGYARVETGEKYNFIDKKGQLLFEKRLEYDKVGDFHGGYFLIYLKDKGRNFLDNHLKYLF